MIRTNPGGPIRSLKGTSDGGQVTVAEVPSPTNQSQVRFTKFAADGSQIASTDFGTTGNDRPLVVIEITPLSFAVLGVANYAANGLGQIFVSTITISGSTANPVFHLVPGLTQCSINAARQATGGFVIAGIDAGTDPLGDMLYAKISPEGSLVWNWRFGYQGSDFGRDIMEMPNGDFTVLGTIRPRGNVVGDDSDIFFGRISLGGAPIWSRSLGNQQAGFNEFALSFEETSNGFLILGAGNSEDRQGTAPHFDILIIQTDATGNIMEEDLLGEEGTHEFPTALLKVSTSQFVISGAAQVPGKGYDAYLAGIDLNDPNLLIWERHYGGMRDDLAMSVVAQANGLLVSGLADGTMSFTNPASYSQSGAVWLADATPTGNVRPSSLAIPDMERISGMPLRLNLSAFFYDIGGDALTFSATVLPPDLTLNPSTGLLSGQAPVVNETTAFEIAISAGDNQLSASETFTLTVRPAN